MIETKKYWFTLFQRFKFHLLYYTWTEKAYKSTAEEKKAILFQFFRFFQLLHFSVVLFLIVLLLHFLQFIVEKIFNLKYILVIFHFVSNSNCVSLEFCPEITFRLILYLVIKICFL